MNLIIEIFSAVNHEPIYIPVLSLIGEITGGICRAIYRDLANQRARAAGEYFAHHTKKTCINWVKARNRASAFRAVSERAGIAV